jgi:hypothetical protein
LLTREPWRFLPHAVGRWFSSLRDFNDSECTIEKANTNGTVCTRRVHHRILMDDAMAGDFTDGEMRTINHCRLFLQVERLSDVCIADGLTIDRPWTPSAFNKNHFAEHDQESGPSRYSRSARARGQYGDGSSDRTHAIPRTTQPAPPDTRPVDARPDLRIWIRPHPPMLCQATVPLGTSSTSWKYHPAGIESTRRFKAYRLALHLFSIHARPMRLLSGCLGTISDLCHVC